MMIMQALKQGTKASHDQIEELAYSHKIMGGTIDLEEYSDLILKNYWLHSLVENAIYNALSSEEQKEINFAERRKLGFLYDDLEELGLLRNIKLPENHELPYFHIKSFAEAMGALYVLEGATLGGAIIRRELLKIPTISSASSLHYYTCYGREIGSYWKAFVQYAAEKITNPEDVAQAVEKAKETFDLFAAILKLPTSAEGCSYIDMTPAESQRKSA